MCIKANYEKSKNIFKDKLVHTFILKEDINQSEYNLCIKLVNGDDAIIYLSEEIARKMRTQLNGLFSDEKEESK